MSVSPPNSENATFAKSSFRIRFYRFLFRFLFSVFGRLVLGKERWDETVASERKLFALRDHPHVRPCIWFHAASVGELESLWSVIVLAHAEDRYDFALTVFSSSAWKHLHRMARTLPGRAPLYVGYSPLEGDWGVAFMRVQPSLFVTAKYEAWPDMWNALAERGVKLAIIGAKPRSSLLWAKRVLNILGGKIPSILFFSFDVDNEKGLAKAFPASEIRHGSDPRWDRVFQRGEKLHPRVQELAESFRDLPRPWGVIGSAWASDLLQISPDRSDEVPGTTWVVPHKVDPRSISEIEILLRERGWTPVRTGNDEKIRPAGRISPLVDEMGFLAELYSVMDWCLVGGGFGSSVHSTIEPSIYGLPIIAGPHGRAKFDEIPLLEKQGQLKILSEPILPNSLTTAIQTFAILQTDEKKQEWKRKNRQHQGASQRIWTELRRFL